MYLLIACKFARYYIPSSLFPFRLLVGKRRYDRKQRGYGGQTKPVFRKKVTSAIKSSAAQHISPVLYIFLLPCLPPSLPPSQAKTTKKVVLRMECTKCHKRKQVCLKRCKHFELGGDKKRKVRPDMGMAMLFVGTS